MADLFLKPAEGLVVLDPDSGKPLPAGGTRKQDTTFWRRRLAAGSAVEVTETAKAEVETTRKEELDDEHLV